MDATTTEKPKADHPTKVIIGLRGSVRISFPHLLERWSGGEGEAAYAAMFLIDKNTEAGKADIEALKAAIKAVAQKKNWLGTTKPAGLRIGLHDGDEMVADPLTGKQGYKKDGSEFRGHMYLNASSKNFKPDVVVGKNKRNATAEDIVAGYFVAVSLDVFPYKNKSGAGISIGLQNVWILKKGEPLAGAVHRDMADDLGAHESDFASDDFGDGGEAGEAGDFFDS